MSLLFKRSKTDKWKLSNEGVNVLSQFSQMFPRSVNISLYITLSCSNTWAFSLFFACCFLLTLAGPLYTFFARHTQSMRLQTLHNIMRANGLKMWITFLALIVSTDGSVVTFEALLPVGTREIKKFERIYPFKLFYPTSSPFDIWSFFTFYILHF